MMNMYFDKRKEFDLFVPRVFVYFLIIFFAIGCGMATYGLEILMVFTTPKYYGATRALAPMILAMVCFASLQVTALGLTITRKIKYFVWFSVIAAILNTGLNFLLIPKFQMVGAAWATVLTYLFLTIGYWLAGKKFLPLRIDLQKILKLVGLSVLLLFVAPLSWKFGFVENLLIKTAEYIVFLGLIYFLGIFERQELIYVKKYLGQIKTRINRRVGINYGPEIDV